MKHGTQFLFKLSCLAMILAAIVLARPWESLPPAWNPWHPLEVQQPLTPITRMKLSRLESTPDDCLKVLAAAPDEVVDYLALDDYTAAENCPLENVVRVASTGVKFNAPFTLTCPLLVRWLMFELHELQPLALQYQGSRVESIDHYGTLACRNVYHRTEGRLSQHATASALDVATFRFANGKAANILSDWRNGSAPDSSAFLLAVHDSACDYFGTVLGPDYNAPHANHFHLDTSSFNLCR